MRRITLRRPDLLSEWRRRYGESAAKSSTAQGISRRSDLWHRMMMATPDRHDALVDKLADHVLAHGLAASSLRPLARAAGTSDRMLLYYFADKDAVIGAALARIAARMVTMLDMAAPRAPLAPDALRDHLAPLLTDPNVWPYMRVWLDMAARAAQGDVAIRTVGGGIGRAFLDWLARHLAAEDREGEAARLLIEIEGTMLLASLGLVEAIAAARG
ncbi:MAG: TetR/AcrR family transcriptional regulator [Sphingopyxis sp.]|nr:TetR/AcrR family transcriptional regulator [Sphingopyxis sp.]